MIRSVAVIKAPQRQFVRCTESSIGRFMKSSSPNQGNLHTTTSRPFSSSYKIQLIRPNNLSRFNRNGTSHANSLLHKTSKRSLSDKPPPPQGGDKAKGGSSGEETSELVLTPGQKVVAGTRLSIFLGMGAFACACAYFIGKELFPSKMSPNAVFDKAFAEIQQNEQVKNRFGAPLKAYGRDHGGHREGRRNFIEHNEFTDPDDGSKRTRVRFNLEGQHGTAFVFAEVSKDMPSGEFVYLLVQDKRGGRVLTLIDNRTALKTKQLMGGSKEGADAFSQLLSGKK